MNSDSPSPALTPARWYEGALDEGADTQGAKNGRWHRGLVLLRMHVSLYLLSVVILFAINLIRSPDRLWIDRVALAWAALIVIHATIAGLIWAVGLLNQGDMTPTTSAARPQPRSSWISVRNPIPQDADFRMASTAAPQTAVTPEWGRPQAVRAVTPVPPPPRAKSESLESPRPAGASLWDGWTTAIPHRTRVAEQRASASEVPAEERASWKEASAAAWLTRDTDTKEASNHETPAARSDNAPS